MRTAQTARRQTVSGRRWCPARGNRRNVCAREKTVFPGKPSATVQARAQNCSPAKPAAIGMPHSAPPTTRTPQTVRPQFPKAAQPPKPTPLPQGWPCDHKSRQSLTRLANFILHRVDYFENMTATIFCGPVSDRNLLFCRAAGLTLRGSGPHRQPGPHRALHSAGADRE